MKPTYKEFYDLVKSGFMECMKTLSEEEVDRFLAEEEDDIIRAKYEFSSKQFDRGEITETIFRNGSVSAAVSTLYLLY